MDGGEGGMNNEQLLIKFGVGHEKMDSCIFAAHQKSCGHETGKLFLITISDSSPFLPPQ